jgi:hypothetical protein
MKRILFLLLILHSEISYCASYTKTERDTINSAFEALKALQVLYVISKRCNNSEYIGLAPKNELDSVVKNKLHIDLSTLESMAKGKKNYMLSFDYQLEGVECKKIDVEVYLSALYDEYDLAKFSLDLYEPISYGLTMQ